MRHDDDNQNSEFRSEPEEQHRQQQQQQPQCFISACRSSDGAAPKLSSRMEPSYCGRGGVGGAPIAAVVRAEVELGEEGGVEKTTVIPLQRKHETLQVVVQALRDKDRDSRVSASKSFPCLLVE